MRAGRRHFLQVGIAGAAFLATIRWLDRAGNAWAAATPGLDPQAKEIIRALVPVVLAGELPVEAGARPAAIDETVDAYARAVSRLAPAIQEEIAQMLSLLAFAPTRIAMTGIASSWREASATQIAEFLQDWRYSRFELKRAGYRALTQLIQGAWFDNPLAWRMVGYPGPPALPA